MPASPRKSTTPAPQVAETETAVGEPVPDPTTPAPDPTKGPADGDGTTEEQTLTIRLPFLTVALARPARPPAEATGRAPRPGPAATGPTPGLGDGERLLFYTGVAALGIAGVLEWPAAAAIAAGTYIASRSRRRPARDT